MARSRLEKKRESDSELGRARTDRGEAGMRAVASGRDACIYCGGREKLTKDHVPPKALFPTPRPSDLITVPACRSCNKSFEKDDEYFRLVVLTQAESTGNPVATKLWSDKVIHGTLHRSPALKNVLLQSIGSMEVTTPAGVYLGDATTIRVSRPRTDRVVRRIITALHWHHYGHTPIDGVKFSIMMGPDPKHPGVAERTAREVLGGRPWITKGGGAFRYAYDYVAENPNWGAWLLVFHSMTFALVLLSTDELGEKSHGPAR